MILLSRLNGKNFYLNCEHIKWLESTPDTIITMDSGEKIMVKEDVEKVVELTVAYKKRIFQEPPERAVAQK